MLFHLQLTGDVGSETFSAREVRKVLAQYPGKHVDVLIDSFGGSLPEGLSICGAFRDHGDVTVHFRGMNASAATLASMGAKKIVIAPESFYLVHKVEGLSLTGRAATPTSLRASSRHSRARRRILTRWTGASLSSTRSVASVRRRIFST